ncbi:hypothetical protein [Vibrio neptunius]|uniref:hypothetical protein n=1 Tax=Vibrio neptunius TaxID=170651 RepID=UPI0019D15CED|nr:hypothetical protein [Vibrio neptunius]MBN3575369.1 hypothetical protein [Vibrio neptunius]
MSNYLPIPPKTSMFWDDHDFTFEQAKSAYEADGNLLSFANVSDTPAEDIDGAPPKHSMF